MPKLCQVIAVAPTKKAEAHTALTHAHHHRLKEDQIRGHARVYKPLNEDGEIHPDEYKNVQATVADALNDVTGVLTDLFDVVLTQDSGNAEAKADVVVDGKVLLKDVPVTYLLFLQKQLVDLETFVSKLPVLPGAEEWVWSDAQDCWVSRTVRVNKTKKVPKNHVKAEATERHPAQVEVYTEDTIIGHYLVQQFSGAMKMKDRNEMAARIKKLQVAVVQARELANSRDVQPRTGGADILAYVFQGRAS